MRIGDTIYLDHNASTPLDPRVFEEMRPYFSESFGNPHSAEHSMGWAAERAIEHAASRVARLLGADPDEIIFTSGATESNNLALLGIVKGINGVRERNIVLGATDHKSSLSVGRALQNEGARVTYVSVDSAGRIDMDMLRTSLKEGIALVSICLVNSEIGTVQEWAEIARIVKEFGALLHLDAAQAPCAIDLSELAGEADFISLSAHKIYGPKGVGALFVRRELQSSLRPLIYGGGQQNNLRSGTLPTPLCVGFGGAAALLSGSDPGHERERVRALRDRFVAGVRQLPYTVSVNADEGQLRHPGTANLRFHGFSGRDLLAILQPRIAASTGSACTSGVEEPSYVLRAIGLSDEEAASSIRFCIGRHSGEADIDESVELIKAGLQRMAESGMR